jgi:hypothetical protein
MAVAYRAGEGLFVLRKQARPSVPIDASLAVAGQYFLAGGADLCAVCLQAVQDTTQVIRINLQLGLTKLDHVWMASGALVRISSIRRRLSMRGYTGGKAKSDRQD